MNLNLAMEMHIWLDNSINTGENILTTFMDTKKAVDEKIPIIHTTQTTFCSWRYNRRLFVHVNNEIHELTIGKCFGTNREIREGHNMEKLLLSGEFSWF